MCNLALQCIGSTGWKATSKAFFIPPSSELIYRGGWRRFQMCNSNLTPRQRQSDVNLTTNLQEMKPTIRVEQYL